MIVNSAFDIYQMDSIFVVILYQGHTKIASQIWEKVSLNCEAPHANRYGDPGKPRQRCTCKVLRCVLVEALQMPQHPLWSLIDIILANLNCCAVVNCPLKKGKPMSEDKINIGLPTGYLNRR